MSRIDECFSRLRAVGRRALIPFVTAGDPRPPVTVPLLHAMVEAGADLIELGVPFSDPMADGPVIQRASERALRQGTSLRRVLEMVRAFRRRDAHTPLVLMGYLNPIEAMGYERFAREAAAAGVDGVLTVDMSPEEAEDYTAALAASRLDPIFLLAPTTTEARLRVIAAQARGFVYYVSLKGVTGAATLDVSEVTGRLVLLRRLIDLPIGVGFGIRDAAAAAAIARVADAVVVGSALVRLVEESGGEAAQEAVLQDRICGLLRAMRTAMDEALCPDTTVESQENGRGELKA